MSALTLPRLIRIGGGVLAETPAVLAQLGVTHPIIVTDRFMTQSGPLGALVKVLGAAGISARIFSDAVPDPTLASVEALVRFMGEGQQDCVIGLGGGSPIDTAKAAAVLSARGGSLRTLKAPHEENVPGLPIIAIPTTAGTGSEATRFTIITDEANDEKMLCQGLAYLPMGAIIDYELTLSKPRRLTADTGIDALTHAIEAYVSRRANAFSDGMARTAMRLISENLHVVCAEPGNRAAREAMMLGAFQAGIAFSNASVALVHGMSRPIGARFHVAHGLSNAMLLTTVTTWSAPAAVPRYADCARAMGLARTEVEDAVAVSSLLSGLHRLNIDLDVPTPKSYGIPETSWFDAIPSMAQQALASGSPANNPRLGDVADIEKLYRDLWA